MVLSGLAGSIRGLIRRIRQGTLASTRSRRRRRSTAAVAVSPPGSGGGAGDSEIGTIAVGTRPGAGAGAMTDEDLGGGSVVLQPSPLLVVAAAAERAAGERGAGAGFMSAARMVASSGPPPGSGIQQQQQQPMVSRTASSKRKLEELESGGVAESSASGNSCQSQSQVRARRDNTRDELPEAAGSSIAESSGRDLRYDGGGVAGTCATSGGEAQALDSETEMREGEGGSEAIDVDAMCEDVPGWNNNKTVGDGARVVLSEDRVDEMVGVGVGGVGAGGGGGGDIAEGVGLSREAGSSLGGPPQAGESALGPSPSNMGGVVTGGAGSFGVISSSRGGDSLSAAPPQSDIGRGGGSTLAEEDYVAGKDGELYKESELDGSRGLRDKPIEEELGSTRRFCSNLVPVTGPAAGVDGSSSSSGVAAAQTLSSLVSSGAGGNGSDASCGTARAMLVDPVASSYRLQFFVRTYIDGRTVVLHGNATDSIESVHQQILVKTGLPVSEQRLIFGGRQLQHDQTLESCHVVNDATLNLVARMRSTALPHSWQLINDMVATVRRMCAASGDPHVRLLHSQDTIRQGVQEFLRMASKSVPVSEHMQVFQLAGATSALVMLLLSQVESNRECAEESITHFLQANDEYLPAHIHCHCAPVLLDFCKLLAKSAPNHSLYSSCRNALARLLDTMGVAHGSPYFYEAKADTIVHDFSPFVNELSLRLSSNLRWIAKSYIIKDSPINFASYVKEAKDFTAFVIPLCKAMEVCKGIDASGSSNARGISDDSSSQSPSPIPSPSPISGPDPALSALLFSWSDVPGRNATSVSGADAGGGSAAVTSSVSQAASGDPQVVGTKLGQRLGAPGVEIGSHAWLRSLFVELLDVIDICLAAVAHVAEKTIELQGAGGAQADDRERPLGWAPFLVVLKGLHSIAKLYEGAMSDLLSVLRKRQAPLNLLIRQSRWHDDDFWLLEHRALLDFESKRRLVMAMLPEPQDDHDERQEILVHRSQLLSESFEMLAYVEPEGLQGGISVEFATEEATGPGVLREWFSMICREIFNCQNALFLPCPKDRRRFFPNPASGVNPGHLTYFRFCGRVIALALMHRVQVDVVFAVTFFKQLAGLPISWEDAKDADPTLYESCKKILEMDPETIDSDALGLTFVSEVEELGTRKTLELCQGGKEMVVNSKNRRQFVELLVQRRLVSSVADQIKSFSQGFSDLLVNATHQQFLRALEPEELDLMLYGRDRNICLEDWRKHTEYHDYMPGDLQILWFWLVVDGMTMEQRRRLLFFSTSVTHLPAEGFAGLSSKFHIHRAHTDTSWLPTAHTCFFQLVLPAYPTYEVMHARLHAISEEHIAEGFGFA